MGIDFRLPSTLPSTLPCGTAVDLIILISIRITRIIRNSVSVYPLYLRYARYEYNRYLGKLITAEAAAAGGRGILR